MEFLLTQSGILFVLGLIGVAFTVFNFLRKPHDDIERKQIIADKDISSKATILAQKEMESKASLLAQQVEWEKIASEKKFSELGKRLDDAFALAQNHTHSIGVQVELLSILVNNMNLNIVKLETIVDERLPNK